MKKWITALLTAVLLCGCASPAAPEATAPEATVEITQTTQPPTEATDAPAQPPVVTKDPTGEKLAPGGKTWFVARAEGASILTWEFLSPEGAVYSVTDTMTMHPGLLLDISKEDTITLENVPLSLNGWSARARFDGPGGSVTSQAALITVAQSQGAYDAVIERYRTALARKDEGDSVAYQYDISEMILYAAHVGYATQDLDGDGTDELIIAGIGYDIPQDTFLFEIFTLQNGAPVSVSRSTVRARLYLMNDGRLFLEGSNSAASSCYSVMQYSGGTLRFLNGLYTTDAAGDGSTDYYFTTSNQYGDPALMAGDSAMEEKAAMTFINSWRDAVCLPDLCLIA